KFFSKLPTWYLLGDFLTPLAFATVTISTALPSIFPNGCEELKLSMGDLSASRQVNSWESLQLKTDEKAQEMSISKPVTVRLWDNPAVPLCSLGAHIGPGSAIILKDRNSRLSWDEEDFMLRHELAHIYHNDSFLLMVIYLGALLFVSYILDLIVGSPENAPSQIMKGMVTSTLVSCLYSLGSRYIEKRADRTAVLRSLQNPEGTARGGVEAFEKARSQNKLVRGNGEGLIGKLISKEGENWQDLNHPSLQSRIDQLKSLKRP
ncbi:MAG: M48 family metalloprotease, partial [Rhabdochlamydiaceae bacterium]